MEALMCQVAALPKHRSVETSLQKRLQNCRSLAKELKSQVQTPRKIASQTVKASLSLPLATLVNTSKTELPASLEFLWFKDHVNPQSSTSTVHRSSSPGEEVDAVNPEINSSFSHATAADIAFDGANWKNWEQSSTSSETCCKDGGADKLKEYTKESFSNYLHRVPVSQLKDAAKMCYVSNLAYIIADIKPDELDKFHNLRFVTSSLALKEAAAAAAGDRGGQSVQEVARKSHSAMRDEKEAKRFEASLESPETARALATAASYLQQHQTSKNTAAATVAEVLIRRGLESQLSSSTAVADDDDDDVASTSSSANASCEKKKKRKAERGGGGGEDQSESSFPCTPCEWFVCDEKDTATRIFAIQGSESLASWRTNILFQPVHFENPSTGALVHHGIYEAAKAMYEQMLPSVQEHIKTHGARARFHFTGHSLGGSLGGLLSLMFRFRGVVPASALLPVYTFGAPQMMCGGDTLLKRLGLQPNHIQSVIIAGDLVPRIFACDFPDQIVEILKHVSQRFRNHSCLLHQRQLYVPMGQMLILQPDARQAPGHPLLPSGSGLYAVRQPKRRSDSQSSQLFQGGSSSSSSSSSSPTVGDQAAERAFLNNPHPLEIMSNPTSYGSGGSISRDHDPRSYAKAVNHVLRLEIQQRTQAQQVKKENNKLKTAVSTIKFPEEMSRYLRRNAAEPLGVISVNTADIGPSGAALSGIGAHLQGLQGLRTSSQQIALGQTPALAAPRASLVLGSQKDRSSRHSSESQEVKAGGVHTHHHQGNNANLLNG